jgi:hypothetical protein
MTFTSPTGEIGLQGTLPLSYKCSGTIEAGQGVYVVQDMEVKAIGTGMGTQNWASGCVGVAEYKETDGSWIAVYGPGAIVNVIISGSSKCFHGAHLCAVAEGKWAALGVGACNPSGVAAIALEDQATANGTARVLLR